MAPAPTFIVGGIAALAVVGSFTPLIVLLATLATLPFAEVVMRETRVPTVSQN